MTAGLLFCLLPHLVCRLVGRPSPWPRRFLTWVGRRAGLRPRIVGSPWEGPSLIVANHVSWLDIMLVAEASGAAFVSRDDVARWPVIGWLARQNDTVFVARSERRSVHGQTDALRRALSTGRPIALFPEGTTDGGPNVLPFRASLLQAVFPASPGLKVQPVAIDYGAAGDDIAWVGGESASDNARRVLSRRGAIPVTLRFLDPIDPAGLPDRKRLAQAARDAIVASLGASAALQHGL
jgi:1-acyl-sn-glycerol-3-phosphate acyltransferase